MVDELEVSVWQQYMRALGLIEKELETIRYDHRDAGVKEQIYQAFCKWQDKAGAKACPEKLIKVALKRKLRRLAETFCRKFPEYTHVLESGEWVPMQSSIAKDVCVVGAIIQHASVRKLYRLFPPGLRDIRPAGETFSLAWQKKIIQKTKRGHQHQNKRIIYLTDAATKKQRRTTQSEYKSRNSNIHNSLLCCSHLIIWTVSSCSICCEHTLLVVGMMVYRNAVD